VATRLSRLPRLSVLEISIRTEVEAELIISTITNLTKLNGVMINRSVLLLANEIEKHSRDKDAQTFVNEIENRSRLQKHQLLSDHCNQPLPDSLNKNLIDDPNRHSRTSTRNYARGLTQIERGRDPLSVVENIQVNGTPLILSSGDSVQDGSVVFGTPKLSTAAAAEESSEFTRY
jgi:hypothetical protein